MATQEQIEKLKENWRNDPCWDIETTEGFEEHHDELLAYRIQVEAETEKKMREQANQRVAKMKEETGITDQAAALYLHTFAEIEIALHRSDSELELNQAEVQQVRATLLLAAQVKRVADELQFMRENQESEIDRQERLNLWRR